ncbi:hypothetical protein JCM14076_23730 [Methylosoma difficile]
MENKIAQKFLPYHYPAIFHRTFEATKESQGVVCALLCATALEAFIHDFIGLYKYVKTNPICYGIGDRPVNNYLKPNEIELLEKLIISEQERESLEKKFKYFTKWKTSEQPYQDFKTLICIRNSLAHLKPEELIKYTDENFIEGYPKFLNNFFQKKILEKPKHFVSWIELIETQEFCLWCQNTAYKMVTETIDKLPDSVTKEYFSGSIRFFFDIDVFRKRYKGLQ